MRLRWRERRRLTKLEHLLAAATWVLSGVAGFVAVRFAWAYKPHVFLPLGLAYALVWAMLAYYAYAQRLHRRLFCLQVWLVSVALAGVLIFVHFDDLPARLVFRDDPPAGPRFWLRPDAPSLYWSIAFDGAWAVIFSIRALWLNWRVGVGGGPDVGAARPASSELEAIAEAEGLGDDERGSGAEAFE